MRPSSSVIPKLAAVLSELLPGENIKANADVLARRMAERLDLVTREEFDVQTKVLQRTREKLKQLEAAVAELEAASKQ